MHTELHNTDTASLIDELGNLQAAIKELEEREKKLSTEIKTRLDDKVKVKGTKFVASKTTYSSDRLDTKAVEKALGNKDTMKANGFYKTTKSTRLNIEVLAVWEAAA